MMEFFALIADHVSTEVGDDEAARRHRRSQTVTGLFRRGRAPTASPAATGYQAAHALQTQRERLSDDEWYRAVITIHINSQTLARQIDKLLEEAHAEVQARSLHPERLELSELLRTTANGFAFVPAHDVRFRGADDVWVRVDRAALNHALGNLIDNAIKYSPDGGGSRSD
jgi:signal transduction histidine kinase